MSSRPCVVVLQVAKLQQALEVETISDDASIKAAIAEKMGLAKTQVRGVTTTMKPRDNFGPYL